MLLVWTIVSAFFVSSVIDGGYRHFHGEYESGTCALIRRDKLYITTTFLKDLTADSLLNSDSVPVLLAALLLLFFNENVDLFQYPGLVGGIETFSCVSDLNYEKLIYLIVASLDRYSSLNCSLKCILSQVNEHLLQVGMVTLQELWDLPIMIIFLIFLLGEN